MSLSEHARAEAAASTIVSDPVNGPTFEESLRCRASGGRILILGFLGGPPTLARTKPPAETTIIVQVHGSGGNLASHLYG